MYRVLGNLEAHVTGAIKGLAGEAETNWCENTGTLLYYPEVKDGGQQERG